MLQKKAVELNAELDGSSTFKGSPGFVNKFKKRHNITCLHHIADKKTSDRFYQELANYINETKTPLDKIYNADKTGLCWKMLPSKLPIADDKSQESFGNILYKDRVALMICTNATGSHKLPILVIGKNNQSHCFNNVQFLPVFYEEQQNATMDSELMLKWYKDIFLPEIEQHHGSNDQQCLLLLENAPCQLSAEQFNTISQRCKVMFLLPNVKSLVQPVNQGIIAKCKQIYKRNLLRIALTENTSEGVERVIRSFDLLRCCYLISNAWDSITDNFIRKAWKNIIKAHAHSESQCVEDSEIENTLTHTFGDNKFSSKEIIAWLHNDDDDDDDDDKLETALLNIQEATSLEDNKETVEIENAENEMESETEHDYLIINKHKIKARDAVLAINTIIDYVNQTEDPSKNCDCLFKLWLRAIKELQDT
ncbi:jerky protein homolog-like isoform X2 [Pseudomyrmex gracilis]|nr:jerky protein homolog-like isoform X2 [Pseudomyrmex gracilis]XP_020283872.1 jerky protein homolog-like isoform X2 [Pseudomyrmex gracilis]XP_020283873.1 jerky protein homolog-like isoform X2 [Pseudomyrmex gracilis]